jgi:hypothetical protein
MNPSIQPSPHRIRRERSWFTNVGEEELYFVSGRGCLVAAGLEHCPRRAASEQIARNSAAATEAGKVLATGAARVGPRLRERGRFFFAMAAEGGRRLGLRLRLLSARSYGEETL